MDLKNPFIDRLALSVWRVFDFFNLTICYAEFNPLIFFTLYLSHWGMQGITVEGTLTYTPKRQLRRSDSRLQDK